MRLVFERQWLHALLLCLLLAALVVFSDHLALGAGAFWGMETAELFWLAVGVAIGHQLFVWFCWRVALHTRALNHIPAEAGFSVYAGIFAVLGLVRVTTVFMVAVASPGTLPGDPLVLKTLAVLLLMPVVYLFYSVKRYFGFRRAFGMDHFDSRYRSMPFERRGIFWFSANAMYVFGFLLVWIPALWWGSLAALGLAIFNHLYIWVHYLTIERPDMRWIYGKNG